MRVYVKTRVTVGSPLRACTSKHSKAGANCKMTLLTPCRMG